MRNAFALMDPTTSVHTSNIEVIIVPHRVKRQMGDGCGVMILGATSSFGNLVINVIEGNYNRLKYLGDL